MESQLNSTSSTLFGNKEDLSKEITSPMQKLTLDSSDANTIGGSVGLKLQKINGKRIFVKPSSSTSQGINNQ